MACCSSIIVVTRRSQPRREAPQPSHRSAQSWSDLQDRPDHGLPTDDIFAQVAGLTHAIHLKTRHHSPRSPSDEFFDPTSSKQLGEECPGGYDNGIRVREAVGVYIVSVHGYLECVAGTRLLLEVG